MRKAVIVELVSSCIRAVVTGLMRRALQRFRFPGASRRTSSSWINSSHFCRTGA